ncbi:hypothetical protein Tco_0501047, partial [Tanacetum coccineum]
MLIIEVTCPKDPYSAATQFGGVTLTVLPPSVYEVGGPSTAAAEGPSFPFPAPGLLIPLVVIENLSTRLGNLEYGHGQLLQKVIQVSDVEVEAGVTIREIGPRVFAI